MVMAISSKSRCWRPRCTAGARISVPRRIQLCASTRDGCATSCARYLRFGSTPRRRDLDAQGQLYASFRRERKWQNARSRRCYTPDRRRAARRHVGTRRGSRLWLIAVAGVLLGSVAWLVIARRAASSTSPQLRLITVTTFPGAEGMPSFSPDGNFVAFNWTGPVFSDTSDVWVKAVDGDALWRLTDTPQFHEALPSWSPDGRLIAFQRMERAMSRGVYLVSPHGGPEQKVADKGGDPSWTPDSRALVMRGRTAAGLPAIFEQVLDTGERRQLTSPPPGFVDEFPKVSPDGATLAFVRISESENGQAAVFVVPMANKEGREPARLTDVSQYVGRLDWTPDGREILYPRNESGGARVFRVAVSGGQPPTAIPGIPFGTNMLSVSRMREAGTFRLAFSYGQTDVGLRLVDLRVRDSRGCNCRQRTVLRLDTHGHARTVLSRRRQCGVHIRPRRRFGSVAGRTDGGRSPTRAQPSSLGSECRFLVARRSLGGARRRCRQRVRHLYRRR